MPIYSGEDNARKKKQNNRPDMQNAKFSTKENKARVIKRRSSRAEKSRVMRSRIYAICE